MPRKVKTKKNSRKRKYKRKSLRNKGGCGCGNTLIKGGNVNSASFNGSLPIRYYYGQNDFMNDSNDPSLMQNSRNLPEIKFVGGKKRNKKFVGGDIILGSSLSNNPFFSFASNDGAYSAVNTLFGTVPTSSSIYDHPVSKGFSNYNSPLA